MAWTRALLFLQFVACVVGTTVALPSVASIERSAVPVPATTPALPATFLFTPTVLLQTRSGLREGGLAGLLPAYGALIRAARSAIPATGSPWDG